MSELLRNSWMLLSGYAIPLCRGPRRFGEHLFDVFGTQRSKQLLQRQRCWIGRVVEEALFSLYPIHVLWRPSRGRSLNAPTAFIHRFCSAKRKPGICSEDYSNVIYMNGYKQLQSILIHIRPHRIAHRVHLWRKSS